VRGAAIFIYAGPLLTQYIQNSAVLISITSLGGLSGDLLGGSLRGPFAANCLPYLKLQLGGRVGLKDHPKDSSPLKLLGRAESRRDPHKVRRGMKPIKTRHVSGQIPQPLERFPLHLAFMLS